MRGLRSTIALTVVLAGLFAYIYFVTWKRPPDTGTKQEKVFASLAADKIDELTVKSESGDTTSLKKTDGDWQIVSPIQTPADGPTVSRVTSGLAAAEISRVIDEKPASLKPYGLDAPRVEVSFKSSGDQEAQRLLIGATSPTGGDVFAKRAGGAPVFLVPAYQESDLNQSTFDLRDKTVVRFERDKVDKIELTHPGGSVVLDKQGSDWRIARPLQAPADFGSVEGLIGRLQGAQMKSIVATDPTPQELKKYGLDHPERSATIQMGSATATLLVGDKADDTTVYARDASKPMVVTIDNALAEDLAKGPDEYRRKDLFEFRPFNATHFEIARGGQTIVLDRVKSKDPNSADTWHRVSPNPKDVGKDPMDAFMTKLSNLRASSFVSSDAKTGLTTPAMAVAVKFEDGKKQERVTFGEADDDRYASRPGEPGAAKVDTTDYTELVKSIDELAK